MWGGARALADPLGSRARGSPSPLLRSSCGALIFGRVLLIIPRTANCSERGTASVSAGRLRLDKHGGCPSLRLHPPPPAPFMESLRDASRALRQ